jgi:hypothetical protein
MEPRSRAPEITVVSGRAYFVSAAPEAEAEIPNASVSIGGREWAIPL